MTPFPEHTKITVIGGGLAGSEAAWQAAELGIDVDLYEMRPGTLTPAHETGQLAELVCSNSLGSKLPDRAPGLLKEEMRYLNSLILRAAEETAVPAGGALAVDREQFAGFVTESLEQHARINIIRERCDDIPAGVPTVVSSGPLTNAELAQSIRNFTGTENLAFYDAMAPIVEVDSIDMSQAFRASRYQRGDLPEGDYINCPMTEAEYDRFVDALTNADRIDLRDFEKQDRRFFEACLPIEVLAERNRTALAFGPFTPVGLTDPRTGSHPHAVIQLRQDNAAGTLYNIVGGQTNLKWGEQKRVFQLVPGLQNARFIRFGQMHRNTFINAPQVLYPTLQTKSRTDLFFTGQIAGFEGYMGNAGAGLLAGLNAARVAQGKQPLELPAETMLGALMYYVSHAEPKRFQPMKANFGLLPSLETKKRKRRERNKAYKQRSLDRLQEFIAETLTEN